MIQQVAARSVVGIASVRGRTGSKRANVTCSLGLVSRRLHTESGSRRQGAQISVGGPGRTLARGARSVQICGASSASQAVATPVPKGAAGTGPVILWFKRDLRVDDHDALVALGGREVVCFYCFDNRIPACGADSPDLAPGAVPGGFPGDEALWHAVSSLRSAVTAAGSTLVVRSGRAEEELAKIAAAVGARTVVTEEEVVHEWKAVVDTATSALAASGVTVSTWRGQLWTADGDTYNWREHVATRGALLAPSAAAPLAPLPANVAAGEMPPRPQVPGAGAGSARGIHAALASTKGIEASASWLQVVGSTQDEVSKSLTEYLHLTPGRVMDAAVSIDKERPDTSFAALFSGPLSLGLISPRRVAAEVEKARVALSLMARFSWDSEADAARRRGRSALAAVERRLFHERLGSADIRRSVAGAAEGLAAAPGAEVRVWLWRGHLIPYVTVPCRNAAASAAEAPNVLLVHGFGAFGEHFRGNFEAVSEQCNVFAPTFPGFGRSEKGALPYSQVLWTEFLRDFIEEVVKGPAYVAGNSIGGFMCANLAADYPQIVRGLGLINSAGPITPNYDAAAAAAAPARSPPPEALIKGGVAVLMHYLERSIPSTLQKCYPTFPERADAWLAEEIYRAACDLGAPQVFGSVFYLPTPRPLNYLVQRFGGPVVVIQGALDPLNDAKARARQLGELCPGARVELLQAGHCPHDEDLEGFQRALLGFVRDVERGGGKLPPPAAAAAAGSSGEKRGAAAGAAAAGRR